MIKIAEHKKTTAHHGSSHVEEGKTMAILSYVTLIGWVIALVMNSEKKNSFAKWHMRQSLLLGLAFFLTWIPFLGWILALVLLVLWVMGLISAINGQEKEVPVLGKYAQEWFKGL